MRWMRSISFELTASSKNPNTDWYPGSLRSRCRAGVANSVSRMVSSDTVVRAI